MIPLRDNIRPRTFPIVNYLIIATCGVVFLAQLADQTDGEDNLIERLALIPARVFHPKEPVVVREVISGRDDFGRPARQMVERELPPPPFSPWWTLLTCIFLHGGWMHILGTCGSCTSLETTSKIGSGILGICSFIWVAAWRRASRIALNASSTMPTIGASGAIAGVMGAYLLLYPRANVLTLVPIFVFIQILVVPAPVFLVIWFVLQFFQGAFAVTAGTTEGIAWWAHVGGFATGFVVAWLLDRSHHLNPPVEAVLPRSERPSMYRYYRGPPPSTYGE